MARRARAKSAAMLVESRWRGEGLGMIVPLERIALRPGTRNRPAPSLEAGGA